MDLRLDFTIPEFTRISWANPKARAIWEPRIRRIAEIWQQVEIAAVVRGVKPGALLVVEPEKLPALSEQLIRRRLSMTILGQQGNAQGYLSRTQPVGEGPWAYRVFIGPTPGNHECFLEAWREQNNQKIGIYLGYPQCCRNFFSQYWVDQNWMDTTLPMLMDGKSWDCNGHLECNILLRHLGVRAVSHLPCSFHCEESKAIGKALLEVAVEEGYTIEVDWIYEMLAWPISWSSLHGIAITTTPVLKIVSATDALKEKVEVSNRGIILPLEGVPIEFKMRDYHTDNGFSSPAAMAKAHEMILNVIPPDCNSVLDLGCGNGALLAKMDSDITIGVDSDSEKVMRAQKVCFMAYHTKIEDYVFNRVFDLVLLSCARLDELGYEKSKELLKRISQNCRYFLLYSYGNSSGKSVFMTDDFVLVSKTEIGDMWTALRESKHVTHHR